MVDGYSQTSGEKYVSDVAVGVFGTGLSVRPRVPNPLVSICALPIAISDGATRMLLISQLVAQLEKADQDSLAHFVNAGFTPDLVDRLRNLSIADTMRFAAGYCGFSINVDCQALKHHLANVERAREDRSLYEHFIRHGASPGLVARLFGVSHTDVRRLRKLLCPEVCAGGRPRLPEDVVRDQVLRTWDSLASDLSEKHRYLELSRRFPNILIVALESLLSSNDETWCVSTALPSTSIRRGLIAPPHEATAHAPH